VSRPNTNDYPIYANGKGKHEHFKLYFAKDFTKIKNLTDGDSFLITYWNHSDSYMCHIKVGALIKGSGGYKRAWLTIYSDRKETKNYDTQVRFENGILHTSLPHVKEISFFSTQNISIYFSFRKYNSSVWERAEWERKKQEEKVKEKTLQEERYREYIETAKKNKEEKLNEIRKIWMEINHDVLTLMSECSVIFMRKHQEINVICDNYRKRTSSIRTTVDSIERRRELRKKLSIQRKEEVAIIEKKYTMALNELELDIRSKTIKGSSTWAWSHKDKIEKYGLKVNSYAPIDDNEKNGLLKLEKACNMSYEEYQWTKQYKSIWDTINKK